MAGEGLSSGDRFLTEAAQSHFADLLQISPASMLVSTPVNRELAWVPTLQFRVSDHLTYFVEVASENPYPEIFRLRRVDVLKLNFPISVFCVCAEEAFLTKQSEAKQLRADGYGLLTVASDGSVEQRHGCIPLVQQILREEFIDEIKDFPKGMRTRLAECFDNYNHSAPSGSASIAEVMEGVILKAGQAAAKKGWIPNADVKAGQTAKTLGAMALSQQFIGARAAIGGAQAYISMWRNANHHFPKDRRQAVRKYRDCRHSFIEGLKKIQFFREAMKGIGLTISL